MSDLVDTVCTKCWGRGSVTHNAGTTGEYSSFCPRCNGTGEEPDTFPGWWTIAIVLVIFVVGLFAIWSVH